ncbi:unnamed protein product [Ostreobium quekettii]|uniref:F-box/LRR-repeat protein 15-like leucin rich repeat domain-containing protein n=1 Tax=Ostreobium quekettii TaxID=121088 RepID=A0A8S1JBS6_9CHLO|nr:unnamed protein product [Ostreobium quekettii]|eukprot:evm.model.scf_552.1 EVM.evm.TU.scf_552.1   scf_552:2413-4962(-)
MSRGDGGTTCVGAIPAVGEDLPWAGLIDDLFESLLDQLDCRQVAPLRGVCSGWRDKARRLLSKFEARVCHLQPRGPPLPSVVRLFPELDRIKVTFCGVGRRLGSIACLTELHRLRSLELSNSAGRMCELPRVDLAVLSACRVLARLTLVQCRCTAGMGLEGLARLQELTLSRCSIDAWEPGLGSVLGRLGRLRYLRIEGYMHQARVDMTGVSGLQGLVSLALHVPLRAPAETFEEIARIGGMSSLDVALTDCEDLASVVTVGLECVTAMTGLRELRITAQLADDPHRGIDRLSSLENLRILHISNPSPLGEDLLEFPNTPHRPITDADVEHLLLLKHLTSLGLSQSLATAGALSHVVHQLPCLQNVDLSSCQHANDTVLFAAATLRSLTTLNLSHCIQVTDLGLGALARSGVPLRILDLTGCYALVTDTGLGGLSRLSTLQWLSLAFCERISDFGLRMLVSGTPMLSFLSLHSCLNITDHGISALCASLVHLRELDIAYCYMVSDSSVEGLNKLNSLKHVNIIATRLAAGEWHNLNSNVAVVLNHTGWWMDE